MKWFLDFFFFSNSQKWGKEIFIISKFLYLALEHVTKIIGMTKDLYFESGL
jgi:hypothetical protein